ALHPGTVRARLAGQARHGHALLSEEVRRGMSSLSSPTCFRLTMRGISKRFGSTQALAEVDLELLPGEVHALVGENGAGKSTLMKILSGAEQPDVGHMTLDGQPYGPRGPQNARARGVAMVCQELPLAPHLRVAANLMLGL